jgi:hypothetical protein
MPEQNGDNSFTQPQLREALEKVRPRLAALEPAALIPINVDPVEAATMVCAALPAILDFRSSIQTHLSTFELDHLDSLEPLALALIQSHSLFVGAKSPPSKLNTIITEITQLRDSFLADINGLKRRGSILVCDLTALRGSPSHRRIATDVLTLTNILRNNWEVVSSNCGVTEVELNRAEFLAARLFRLASSRTKAPVRRAEAALERQKIYTLLVHSWGQVRKAVYYLRWEHEDAEEFAPSFFRSRKVGKRKKTSFETTTVAEQERPTTATATTAKPTDKETDPFLS